MNNTNKVHVGKIVKKYRQLKGLNQNDLGKLIGKTQAMISYLEKTGYINKYTLQEIAVALEINSEDIEKEVTNKSNLKNKNEKNPDYFYKHLLSEIDYLKTIIEKQWEVINSK